MVRKGPDEILPYSKTKHIQWLNHPRSFLWKCKENNIFFPGGIISFILVIKYLFQTFNNNNFQTKIISTLFDINSCIILCNFVSFSFIGVISRLTMPKVTANTSIKFFGCIIAILYHSGWFCRFILATGSLRRIFGIYM